jgi:hypothetical protein
MSLADITASTLDTAGRDGLAVAAGGTPGTCRASLETLKTALP